MTNELSKALRKHAERKGLPAFPYDDLTFTLQEAASEIERLRAALSMTREGVSANEAMAEQHCL